MTSEASLETFASWAASRLGLQVVLVDVAGEQIGRGDGHDRRGHQRPDGDGAEGDAGEPAREVVLEELGNDQLRIRLAVQPDRLRARRDGDVAEQGEQPEQQGVGRQDRRISTARVAVLRDRAAVTECGYMNRASAEPRASEAYAQ